MTIGRTVVASRGWRCPIPETNSLPNRSFHLTPGRWLSAFTSLPRIPHQTTVILRSDSPCVFVRASYGMVIRERPIEDEVGENTQDNEVHEYPGPMKDPIQHGIPFFMMRFVFSSFEEVASSSTGGTSVPGPSENLNTQSMTSMGYEDMWFSQYQQSQSATNIPEITFNPPNESVFA